MTYWKKRLQPRAEYRVRLECGCVVWLRSAPVTPVVKLSCTFGVGHGYRLGWTEFWHVDKPDVKTPNEALGADGEKKETAMEKRTAYTVKAEPSPEGRWYNIVISGLPPHMAGVTQSLIEEGQGGVEAMAREVVALLLEVDEDSFDLDIEMETEGENA